MKLLGENDPVAVLKIVLTRPRMYAGPTWPDLSFLNVSLRGGGDDQLVFRQALPSEEEAVRKAVEEARRNGWPLITQEAVNRMERGLVGGYQVSLSVPVRSDWATRSLDVSVERHDVHYRRGGSRVVTRGGPHTTSFTAVIGRARVPLLDALVFGNSDDDDEEVVVVEEKNDRRKRKQLTISDLSGEELKSSREGRGRKKKPSAKSDEDAKKRVDGTLAFDEVVTLLDWERPAPGNAAGGPRPVDRGTMHVQMSLTELTEP